MLSIYAAELKQNDVLLDYSMDKTDNVTGAMYRVLDVVAYENQFGELRVKIEAEIIQKMSDNVEQKVGDVVTFNFDKHNSHMSLIKLKSDALTFKGTEAHDKKMQCIDKFLNENKDRIKVELIENNTLKITFIGYSDFVCYASTRFMFIFGRDVLYNFRHIVNGVFTHAVVFNVAPDTRRLIISSANQGHGDGYIIDLQPLWDYMGVEPKDGTWSFYQKSLYEDFDKSGYHYEK